MFRRLPGSLPPDVVFPANLDELGFFVTDDDKIRKKEDPSQPYLYKVNRNERINENYNRAMNACVVSIVSDRLALAGMNNLRIPLGATANDKHIPVMVSKDLAKKNEVVVFLPDRYVDTGIFSHRTAGNEGVNIGSICNFVNAILHKPAMSDAGETIELRGNDTMSDTGLVVANPSQLIWSRAKGRAMTDRQWIALPRESIVSQPMKVNDKENRVEGNVTFKDHIKYVLDNVLDPKNSIVNATAKIAIIGLEYSGSFALNHIINNWSIWKDRISCFTFCTPQHTLEQIKDEHSLTDESPVLKWISNRTRIYKTSDSPLETLLQGREDFGANVYSSGEGEYEDSVIVRAWPSILDWIDLCFRRPDYNQFT